jgi:mono/diheme cytochrome c family protein
MNKRIMRWMWIVVAVLAAVLLGIAAMSAEPTRLLAEEELAPPGKPSAVRGKEIFEARCASCHGQAGDGSGLEGAANFINLKFVRQKEPSELFKAIRDGVEGTAMPAWGDTLSEMEIWDVLYYAWTFATSPEEISRGRELFALICATCHGTAGDGSGLEGAANFTDQAFVSNEGRWSYLKRFTTALRANLCHPGATGLAKTRSGRWSAFLGLLPTSMMR